MPPGGRLARPQFGSREIVLVATVALLLVLVAFPLFEMLRRSFIAGGHLSLANYIAVLGDRANYAPFLNTLLLGSLTVAGSLAIALPAAWLVARTDLPAGSWSNAVRGAVHDPAVRRRGVVDPARDAAGRLSEQAVAGDGRQRAGRWTSIRSAGSCS